MPNRDLADIRNHYQRAELDWTHLPDDPMAALHQWLKEAISAALYEPTAMTLATVDAQGNPHARILLLKGIDDGLLFYTNYASPKGSELTARPQAACVLFWPELERQIRVEGRVEKISPDASDAYFASRPRDSQLAALASRQGQVVPDRTTLEADFAALCARYDNQPVPRPDNWGGYRLTPMKFEFWQGRPNRLHDRLVFRRDTPDTTWQRERLSP